MERKVKSFDEFKKELVVDTELQEKFKSDPVATINQFQQGVKETDPWIYRIIVLSLGFAIMAIIVGVILLIFNGKMTDGNEVPAIFTAIGSGAIGAFAGLLAPSPQSSH